MAKVLLDREESRREVLPHAMEILTGRVGSVVSMFRTMSGVILGVLRKNGEGLCYVCFWDDNVNSITIGNSGRHEGGELSLLNVVPLCRDDSGCRIGCGCRCSHDLGYTAAGVDFKLEVYPVGGDVYLCHSRHSEKLTPTPVTSRLNVSQMMTDLKIELDKTFS